MRFVTDQIAQDLKFAARYAWRTRLTTVTMILVLSVGIAANAALFTVIHATADRPAPGIPENDALVRLRGMDLSFPLYQDVAKRTDVFALVGISQNETVILDLGGADRVDSGPLESAITFVSPNYFRALGVHLAAGPGLPSDSGAESRPDPVAVINFAMWRDHFGQRADIVGQRIRVNNIVSTIVGVVPRGFLGTEPTEPYQAAQSMRGGRRLWMTLGAMSQVCEWCGQGSWREDYGRSGFEGIALLRPGIGVDEATRAVQSLRQLADSRVPPARRRRTTGMYMMSANGKRRFVPPPDPADVAIMRAGNASRWDERGLRHTAALMGTLTLLILLVTCTNVASLLAGTGMARRREIAVRLSVGASRGRIVRQLVTESALVAVLASGLGLLLMYPAIRIIVRFDWTLVPTPDWSSVVFAVAFAIATAVAFSLLPALHATNISVADALKRAASSVASRSRLQQGFVVAQVACTLPLLALIGVIVMEIAGDARRFQQNPIGGRMITLRVDDWDIREPKDAPDDWLGVQMRGVANRIRAIPGVVGVVLSTRFSVGNGVYRVDASDLPRDSISATFRASDEAVGPGYVALMGWRIASGREFTEADVTRQRLLRETGSEKRVAIIRSDFARRMWGTATAIGKHVRRVWPDPECPVCKSWVDTSAVEIIGVVDAAIAGPSRSGSGPVEPLFILGENTGTSMIIRTRDLAARFIPTVRAIARETMPGRPLVSVQTLQEEDDAKRNDILRRAAWAGGAGIVALGLACLGLYAVIAFAVGQRTREIGIRVALGQSDTSVVRMFMKSGALLCGVGVLLGLPITMLGWKLLPVVTASQTKGVPPVVVVVGVTGVVVIVAAVAILMPARRAVTADPLSALRGD